MASSKEYLEFILEQLSELDDISYRAMMFNIFDFKLPSSKPCYLKDFMMPFQMMLPSAQGNRPIFTNLSLLYT